MRKIFACLLIQIFIFAPAQSAAAFETDQFNLPRAPLADIGAEFSDYVSENIEQAINKVNSEIEINENCRRSPRARHCDSPAKTVVILKRLRSNEAVEDEVYKRLGSGIVPFTISEKWIETHKFKAEPARYKSGFSESIYKTFPSNYLSISPTVKIHGVLLGTDKVAHIFQQGYSYLKIIRRQRLTGLSETEAIKKAVNWGKKTENTYFGFWVSGVYSNADLAANYAGLNFYRNLTAEITRGNSRAAPILKLENGRWQQVATPGFINFFITDHLNEALNPSVYASAFRLNAEVRSQIKKYGCAEWKDFYPDYGKTDFERLTANLTTTFDADYGIKQSRRPMSIAENCF